MTINARRRILAAAVAFTTVQTAVAAVLEEVVVTAQKREQNLQDVGVSVTAFSGNTMRELDMVNIKDIAAHLVRDAVPAPLGSRPPVCQRIFAKAQIQIRPAVKGRPGDAQPRFRVERARSVLRERALQVGAFAETGDQRELRLEPVDARPPPREASEEDVLRDAQAVDQR